MCDMKDWFIGFFLALFFVLFTVYDVYSTVNERMKLADKFLSDDSCVLVENLKYRYFLGLKTKQVYDCNNVIHEFHYDLKSYKLDKEKNVYY